MRVFLVVFLLCVSLFADREGGPYIGFGYGVSKFDDDGLYKTKMVDDSLALIIYGGAYINKHLSVEVSYTDMSVREEFKALDYNGVEQKVNFTSFDVSTLAHYAFFNDILDFYAKFGVGRVSMSGIDSSGFGMLFGGGASVRFTKMFSAKLGYDLHSVKKEQIFKSHRMKIDALYMAFEVQF